MTSDAASFVVLSVTCPLAAVPTSSIAPPDHTRVVIQDARAEKDESAEFFQVRVEQAQELLEELKAFARFVYGLS